MATNSSFPDKYKLDQGWPLRLFFLHNAQSFNQHKIRKMKKKILLIVLVYCFCPSLTAMNTPSIVDVIGEYCVECPVKMQTSTGSYILEYGEESLLSRAWMVDNAGKSIDVQYFIWSTDNIGILASEALLRAAERGVSVRVIVDDFLIDADNDVLVALNRHPNVEVKVYNPKYSVGTSAVKRFFNVATDFRGVNQRMHDKTVIVDGVLGITGGRNMADEYYDYDQAYNFRDRDIVLMGLAVADMGNSFQAFWDHPVTVSIDVLLDSNKKRLSKKEVADFYDELHQYALNEENFEFSVRQQIQAFPQYFPKLAKALVWSDVQFISDKPGKNDNKIFLSGGGETTNHLFELVSKAKKSVLIQSPYLVVPDGGIELLEELVGRGISVKINTNSLASTDNLMAFSGYHKQRKKLLKAGVEIYEYKPHPAIKSELIQRYPRLKDLNPVFAIHAKSMVVDDNIIYIGTFNLDPRSANLNTEVGVLIENEALSSQLKQSIQKDMLKENSWKITPDFNPDSTVSLGKRMKLRAFRLLPMKNVL